MTSQSGAECKTNMRDNMDTESQSDAGNWRNVQCEREPDIMGEKLTECVKSRQITSRAS